MIDRADRAMKALQASFFARAVYFAEHPSVGLELEQAAELLRDLLDEQERLVVLAYKDRIVCNGVPLPSADALIDGLFGRLRALDAEHLTFLRGVQVDELASFLEQVEAGARPVLGSAHLRVGSVVLATSASEGSSTGNLEVGQRLRGHAAALSGVWGSLLEGEDPDLAVLAGVVTDICTTVAASRDVLLPLAALKAHDEYTFVHAINVGILSSAFCDALCLPPDQVAELTTAALLHDIGKQLTPRDVLQKQGPLTAEERAVVERHPVDGARLLLEATSLPEVATVVAYEHHIGLDRSGYPIVPAGYCPQPVSRIVQVADVFDALRSHRPYRAGLSLAETERIMRDWAGSRLDVGLVETFLEHVAPHTDREILDDEPDEIPIARAA